MADEEQQKSVAGPKSFRVTPDIVEKVKEITDGLGKGATQQEAFAKMIEAYEMQQAKITLGEDGKVVEEFEQYINVISRLFLQVMENKQMLEKTIGAQYEALIVSKDKVIQELQEKVEGLSTEKSEAVRDAESARDDNREQRIKIRELEEKVEGQQKDFAEKLKDKDELNESFRVNCTDLRKKNEEMTATVERAEQILSENKELKSGIQDMKKQEEVLQGELKNVQADKTAAEEAHQKSLQQLKEKMELESEKRLLEQKQQYAVQIEAVRKEAQAEVDSYQKKYMDQVAEIEAVRKEAQTKIDKYQEKYLKLLERMEEEKQKVEEKQKIEEKR